MTMLSGLTLFALLGTASASNADVAAQIKVRYWAFVQAEARRDVAAIIAFYDDDATVLPPSDAPISGRRNITDYWTKRVDRDSGAKTSYESFTPVNLDVIGDYAIDVETMTGSRLDKATQQMRPFAGKNLVIWHRHSDGVWYILRDMWSGMPTAVAAASPTAPTSGALPSSTPQ